jgi:hypothetical protein
MHQNKLNYFAELAHEILNSETQYKSNKGIISALFEEQEISDLESVVKNRLTVIDSYYSTQMNKRLYGLDELANTLAKYSDSTLKLEANKYLNNPKEEGVVKFLFTKNYGINKSGKPFGKSISLISKYLFFLNNYKFPIYDSLAIISYKLLQNSNYNKIVKPINEHNFYSLITELNIDSKINNYEKLDNLLWLIGKLSKGSFAILMDIDQYLEVVNTDIIKKEFLNPKNKESSRKDEIIRSYIKEYYKTSSLFSDNQKVFFEFVFQLD